MPIADPTRCNDIDYVPAKVAELVSHIEALSPDGDVDPIEAAFRMLGAVLVKRKQCEDFVAWPVVFWNKKAEDGRPEQLVLDQDDLAKLNQWLLAGWQRRMLFLLGAGHATD